MAHDWPGNVRELKNCLTRAMAFAEGDVLYAEDLVFDDAMLSSQLPWDSTEAQAYTQRPLEMPPQDIAQRPPERPAPSAQPVEKIANPRHELAIGLARAGGSFTRLDYQNALGDEVSQRTAQYDLQALVKSGVLRKTGKGPATHYSLAETNNGRN